MNLLVLPPLGGSLGTLESQGQLVRFIDNYLTAYYSSFDKVYVASFADETSPSKKFTVLPNQYKIHRYLYSLMFPFIYRQVIRNCDVVRVMQISSLPTAILCKLLFNVKVFVTYGYDYQKFAKVEGRVFQGFLFWLVKKILLFRADKVFFPVKSMYLLNKENPKAMWLPNGVNLKIISKHAVTKHAIFNILFVGRLEKPKNIDEIFAAAKNANTARKISITIVGEGSIKTDLEEQAKKLQLDCQFTGKISNDQLLSYFEKADLFVLPSVLEGVSKSLLEAMAAGLPVAAKAIEENCDIIANGVNGFLFKNTSELTSIIESLVLKAQTAKKIGHSARRSIEENYDLKKIVQHEISEMIKE